MPRSLLVALLLSLAAVAPVHAAGTPVADPHRRDRITPPVIGNACTKPGHVCAPAPVRRLR
jgi:hypothetical protein